MLILDIELYSDYLLIMFKEIETGKVRYFEMFPGQELERKHVSTLMRKYQTISFNGISYDLPLIQAAIEGQSNEGLKKLSDSIIKSNKPSWLICKNNDINVPLNEWDHIDLIEVAPGKASLKLYGARMGAPKIQDLPIEPNESISPAMRKELRTYCINDLDTTLLLYNTLKPQIALRVSMSEQYGIDLRSKSDAQIAEAVIKSELTKKTGRKYKPLKLKDGATIRYSDPGIVSFEDPELTRIFEEILKYDFGFKGNGSIELPKWLKNKKIKIGDGVYSMGVGGLHSNEKSQLVEVGDSILCELDVSSYYPSIILQQRLSPKSMGKEFLELYKGVVEQRLAAKAKMQEIAKEIELLEKTLANL